MNVIVAFAAPLPTTPILYEFKLVVVLVVFIQKGWPVAEMLNVYGTPWYNTKVGFEPLIAPVNTYSPLPLFVTLNVVFNEDVGSSQPDDDTIKLPLIVVIAFIPNPVKGSAEAVTLPLATLYASVANADCGISNKPLPLPLKIDADIVLVKNAGTFTLNPSTGDIDAVALPLNIFVESIAKLASVILERNLPSPIKNELLLIVTLPLTFTLPLIWEPLCTDSTTKPLSGNADAVTEPDAILNTSWDNADRGKSNNPAPLPVNIDADTGNSKLANVFTENPLSGEIDAVAEPLAILFILKESADSGISNNPAPLPEKVPEPVGITIFPLTNKLPLNIEPLAIEVTKNPLFGLTEAVTLPLAINVAVKAGILNNWEPSPIKKDADTLPLTTTFPINLEPLSIEVTTNPVLGETEAVTLPLDIKVAVNAGILINWEPSPIKNDADTLPLTTTFPIKVEPLWDELTINPVFGATDAVTEPDLISVDINASDVKAERGISDNPAPLPLKNPLPVGMVIFPTVVILPVKVEPLSIEITKNPVSGVTDAVIEPVANWVVSNASGVKAERGMFVNPAPLPLKNPLPVGIVILPLTTILPLNVEPLAIASTKNPLLGDTDAVILPLAIL